MCTVTIFKTESGYQIYMNRDEARIRVEEKPPQFLNDEHSIIGPYDPEGHGTWIAANKDGFWGCLLNGYFNKTTDLEHPVSRGKILPEILTESDPVRAAEQLDYQQYRTFRLIVGSLNELKMFVWDGDKYVQEKLQGEFDQRVSFMTSSGVRQDEVIAIRKSMFENWTKSWQGAIELPAYHLSQEPSPIEGPMMARDHSRTKSITSLTVEKQNVEMRHWAVPETPPYEVSFSEPCSLDAQKNERKAG